MARENIDDISIFLAVECSLGNPLSRFIINRLSKKKNGTSILEESLKYYCGIGESSFIKKLKTAPLCTLLGIGRKMFGADKEAMREYFSDPVARRGLINVMRSIGKYGVKRPFRLVAPFLVVWNYISACNLRCQHCYQGAAKPLPDELDLDEKLDVIDQLVKNDVVALAFSGGEPLMAPDFFEVASYASGKNLYVSLATNGTLLTEEVADRLVECGVKYLEISLDAATPKVHDCFRGASGAWNRTVDGIKNAVSHDELFVCIASTITGRNFKELEALIDLAGELGTKRFLAFNFIPTGNAVNIREADLTPAMREELLETLYRRLKSGGVEVMTTAPQFSRVCMSKSKDIIAAAHFGTGEAGNKMSTLAGFIGGCGAGRLYCAIQPNGIVTPCVYMPIEVGDLRTENFADIWEKSDTLKALRRRDKLIGNCSKCDFKNVCGGCRARAYAYTGNINGCDPGCIRNSAAYEKIRNSHTG
ncbi:MAG: radical SAM protein [Candidatus Methanoperedens sp.]|nr:radical SAM protein [Candidatus Methanoperedens sp.]